MRDALIFLGIMVLAACGGNATVDETPSTGGSGATGAGAAGATGASGGAGAAGGAGASGGSGGIPPSGCTTHQDCGPGSLCLFATGTCAPACDGFCEDCGAGSFCQDCATSSCPDCLDCYAACTPIVPGACDETDPCPPGEQCHFGTSTCQPLCGPNGTCPPGYGCVGCATGSCCGCDDCVDLCLRFDG